MKISISVLLVVITSALFSTVPLFNSAFQTEGTAVLAQKQKGGGMAVLLPTDVTSKQQQILQEAYDIAKKDGHKDPEYLQAVVFKETKAGGMDSYRVAGQEFGLKAGDRYYGISQIKLVAAKDVLKQYPALRKKYLQTDLDEELMAQLMLNDEFNLQVASKYLLSVSKCSGAKGLAYNQGCTGAENPSASGLKYAADVQMFMSQFKANRNVIPNNRIASRG